MLPVSPFPEVGSGIEQLAPEPSTPSNQTAAPSDLTVEQEKISDDQSTVEELVEEPIKEADEKPQQPGFWSNCYNYLSTTKLATNTQWAAKKGVNAAVVGGLNATKKSLCWVSGYNAKTYSNHINSYEAWISEKEKSAHFVQAVSSLSVTLTNYLETVIGNENLKKVMEAQKGDLEKFIHVTLLKMAKNIASYEIKDEIHPPQDMMGLIISRFLHLAVIHFPKIHQGFPDCEKFEGQEKKIKYSHLFYSFSHDFFKMALPNGVNDIEAPYPINTVLYEILKGLLMQHPHGVKDVDAFYPLNNVIWSCIISKLPDNLPCLLYHEVMDPIQGSNSKDLLSLQEGKNLAEAFKVISQQSPKVMPAVIKTLDIEIANKAIEVFSGEDIFKNWIKSWLIIKIDELATTKNGNIQETWKLAGSYIETILLKTFANIASKEKILQKDFLTSLAEKLLYALVIFFKANNEKIAALAQNYSIDAKIKNELVGIFKPLCDEILSILCWNSPENVPLPNTLKSILFPLIQTNLPDLFIQLYRDITIPKISDTLKKNSLNCVDQTAGFIHVIMEHLMPEIKESLAEFSGDIAKEAILAIDENYLSSQLPQQEKTILEGVLNGLIYNLTKSKNLETLDAFGYMQMYLEKFIMQMIVQLAANYPVVKDISEADAKKDMLSSACLHILGLAAKHLDGMENDLFIEIAAYEKLAEGNIKIEAKKVILKKFEPLAAMLLKKAGLYTPKALPVPTLIQKPILEALREIVIPNLILKLFQDISATKYMAALITSKLNGMDPDGKLQGLCKAISHQTTPLIKESLEGSGGTISNKLAEVLAENPIGENAHFPSITLGTDEIQLMTTEINGIFAYLNQNTRNPKALGPILWNFLMKYIEDLAVYCIGNLAYQYKTVGNEVSNILTNTLSNLLKITGKNINEMDARIFIKLQKLNAMPECKEKLLMSGKLAGHFIPLAKELLIASGFNKADDLPVPFFIKKVLWTALNESIFPEFLMKLYQDITIGKAAVTEFDEKVSKFTGLEHLKEITEISAANLIPLIKEGGQENSSVISNNIDVALKENGISGFDQVWIKNGIEHLTLSNEEGIKQTWKFLENYLQKLLYYALTHIAVAYEAEFPKKNIIAQITGNILKILEKYFLDPNGKTKVRLEKLILKHPEKTKDELLFEMFSEEALKITGFDDKEALPVPSFVKGCLLNVLKSKVLPLLLNKLYTDIINPQSLKQFYYNKLNELAIDEKTLSEEISSLAINYQKNKLPQDVQDKLWEIAGTSDIAKQIETTCMLFANDIKGVIKKYIKDEAADIAKLINELLPDKKFLGSGEGGVPWLAEDIKAFVNNSSVEHPQSWEYLENIIETALLKVLVKAAEAVDNPSSPFISANGEHPKTFLAANIIVKLLTIMEKHHQTIAVDMIKAGKASNPMVKQAMMREIFLPVAADLFKIFELKTGPTMASPLEDLPVPEALKFSLWKTLKTKVVPDLLAKMYCDITAWEDAVKPEKHKLRKAFNTTHPEYFCAMISQYVQDFLPFYFSTSHLELADVILNAMGEYLKEAENKEKAQSIVHYMEAHEIAIKELLGKNVKGIGEIDHSAVQESWPMIKNYVEAAMIKIFSGMSGNIKIIENKDHTFLVDTAISLLTIMTEHFVTINKIKQLPGINKSKAYQVKEADMLTGFGAKLHPGVPKNLVDPTENDKLRLKDFFIPFTGKLLELANVKGPKDLPVPAAMQENMWMIMKEKMLPEVFLKLFKIVLEPETLDLLMLNSLETLSQALDSIPDESGFIYEDQDVEDDAKQKELNKACGELIKQLVDLVPQTFTNYVFKNIKIVHTLTAEALGKSVRKYLSKWTLLKFIDQSLFNGLPKIHPGHWAKAAPDAPEGYDKFIPEKLVIKDGKVVSSSHEIKFEFPKTPDEKVAFDKLKIQQAQENSKKLKEKLTETISTRLQATIKEFIKKAHGISFRNGLIISSKNSLAISAQRSKTI